MLASNHDTHLWTLSLTFGDDPMRVIEAMDWRPIGSRNGPAELSGTAKYAVAWEAVRGDRFYTIIEEKAP